MYQVDLWNLGPEQAQMWEIRQSVLATGIFYNRVMPWLVSICRPGKINEELKNFTNRLIQASIVKLAQGRKENPLHHSFQVLENILSILSCKLGGIDLKVASFNSQNIGIVKTYIALALLHDIGDAEASGKVKASEIEEAVKTGKPREEIERIAQEAISFRKQHMIKGSEIAGRILDEHFSEDFSDLQISQICEVIQIHDNPTIAFILDEFGKYVPEVDSARNYLFSSPRDDQAILLREADRMWMISPEGPEKDLMDKVVKGKQPKLPEEQLAYNIERFREERELYDKTPGNFGKFQEDTFFRNRESFELFKKFLRHWRTFPQMKSHEKLREVFSRYLKDN